MALATHHSLQAPVPAAIESPPNPPRLAAGYSPRCSLQSHTYGSAGGPCPPTPPSLVLWRAMWSEWNAAINWKIFTRVPLKVSCAPVPSISLENWGNTGFKVGWIEVVSKLVTCLYSWALYLFAIFIELIFCISFRNCSAISLSDWKIEWIRDQCNFRRTSPDSEETSAGIRWG
jgi:hypothetical protein